MAYNIIEFESKEFKDQSDLLEKLEIYENCFFRKITNCNSFMDIECLLFHRLFVIFTTNYRENSILDFNKLISIDEIMTDDWYFYEDFTKEILNNLEKINLIKIYKSNETELYRINLEKYLILEYFSNMEKIKFDKNNFKNIISNLNNN